MLIKEFIQLFNDPRARAILFVAPIIQIVLFGYAVSTDVKNVATAVYDLDNTPASRALVDEFLLSGYFRATYRPTTDDEIRDILDHGDVCAVIRLNRGFGATVTGGGTGEVQVLLDGADPNTAGVVLSYIMKIADRYNARAFAAEASAAGVRAARLPDVSLRTRYWFNENLESRNYYLPGVIALLVMLVTLLLSSMAVVREKEIGTIEQIMVTPIRQAEYILGKMLPFALVAFFDVILITAVAAFWFEVPIRGNLFLLLGATALYLMSTLGVGLLISTVSRTQQQAMMTAFFFIFPAILLSGFMYPIENMPVEVQYLTWLNPLRYFLIIIRGIFLKGAGWSVLWDQYAALATLGLLFLTLATARFRKVAA